MNTTTTEPVTGTDIVIAAGRDLATVLIDPKEVDDVLEKIKAEAKSRASGLDPSTPKGREAMKSIAFTVSRSKVALDEAGKAMTEKARSEIAKVNAERNKITTTLDALRDEIKKPAIDWEQAEADRIAKHKRDLSGLTTTATLDWTTTQLREEVKRIDDVPVGPAWQEFQDEAANLKTTSLRHVSNLLEMAVEREELAKKAAEIEAQRVEAERIEALRKVEENRKAEAERAERERLDRIEREKLEREKAELVAEREKFEREKADIAKQSQLEAEAEAVERNSDPDKGVTEPDDALYRTDRGFYPEPVVGETSQPVMTQPNGEPMTHTDVVIFKRIIETTSPMTTNQLVRGIIDGSILAEARAFAEANQ